MKFSGAVIVAILCVGPLPAQYWSVGGFGNVVFPGLGHAPLGANPWGNVVTPAMPRGAAASSAAAARFGTLVPGFKGYGTSGYSHRRSGVAGVYAYPVYIGGYGYGYGPAAPDQPAGDNGGNSGGPAQAPPPVVINQYFGQPPTGDAPPENGASNFHYYQAPVNTDAAPPTDTPYYLIALKDHTVYSAVAYYSEGDTLHYFTAGNVHNQVSLSLVDRPLTEQLNRQRNVEVRLPE